MSPVSETTRRLSNPAVSGDHVPDPWAVSEGGRVGQAEGSEVLFLTKGESFGMLCMASVLEHQQMAKVRLASLSPDMTILMFPLQKWNDPDGGVEAKLFQRQYMSVRELGALQSLERSNARNKYVCLSMDADDIDLVSYTVALSRIKCPSADVVVGGSAVTLNPEGALGYSGADFAIMGEGERSLPDLVSLLARFPRERRAQNPGEFLAEFRKIPGAFMREGYRVLSSGIRGNFLTVHELETQPLDYRLLGDMVKEGTLPMITSRGCPFRCSFCLGQDLFGSRFRAWSPEKILFELRKVSGLEFGREGWAQEFTLEQYGKFRIDNIQFWDADFLFSRKRALDFFKMVSRGDLRDRFRFSLQAGVDSAMTDHEPDVELIDAMAKARVESVSLGAENLSDSFIGRNKLPVRFTADDVVGLSCALSDAEIQPNLYIIFGDIDSTPEEIRQSLRRIRDLARKAKRLRIVMAPCIIPYSGTGAHKTILRRGLQGQLMAEKRHLADGRAVEFIFGARPIHPGVSAVIKELDLKNNKFEGEEQIVGFCGRTLALVDKHCK
ncbi:MAG: radical SAM protein [Candidatus Altiarchaeota archaeon]